MVVSDIQTKQNDHVISLYIPLLSGYLPEEAHSMLKMVKEMAVDKGGKRNASGRFLKMGCTDQKIVTANSIPCRGVLQIKRTKEINTKLLAKLDAGIAMLSISNYS